MPAEGKEQVAAEEEEDHEDGSAPGGGASGMLAGIRGFNRAKLRSASMVPPQSAIAGGGSGTPVGSGSAAAGAATGGGGGGGGGMPVSMFDRLRAVVEAKRAAHTGGRNLDAEEGPGSDGNDSEWSVD